MNLIAIVLLGLFGNDNAEFFNASEANAAAGLNWEYVGPQAPIAGNANLPLINEVTGKETVMFVRK